MTSLAASLICPLRIIFIASYPLIVRLAVFERSKSQSGLDTPFDKTVILLDDMVQILALPRFRRFRQASSFFNVDRRTANLDAALQHHFL